MKLISNWKTVALKAHSMWAFFLSLICLILPEALYWFASIDTNPRFWWIAGVVLLIYGIWGRLKDQGIDRTKTQSPAIVLVLALLVVAYALSTGTPERQAQVADTVERPIVQPAFASDAEFLDEAIPFIGGWEGLRLEAYLDIVGVPTVCYGETKGVKLGDSYTKAECDAMFAREILSYRDGLGRYFADKTKQFFLPVSRHVAFVSLAYNVGIAGAGKSTAVRRLNAADIVGACEALTWWNKAGGRVIRGLVRRRTAEHAKCMLGVA